MTRSRKCGPVPDSTAQPEAFVGWSDERAAAYQAARRDIEQLQPGESIVYHEGHLAVDAVDDAVVTGRAAAFLLAGTELGEGVLGQRWIRPERYQYIFWKSRR